MRHLHDARRVADDRYSLWNSSFSSRFSWRSSRCSRQRFSRIDRWSTSTGFWMKSYAPSFIASTAFSIVPKAVITITGQSGSLSLACRSTAMPSAPGRRRSVSTAT
jgi:hypothetical protein